MNGLHEPGDGFPKATVCLRSFLRVETKKHHNGILAFFFVFALFMTMLAAARFKTGAIAVTDANSEITIPEEEQPLAAFAEVIYPSVRYTTEAVSIPYTVQKTTITTQYIGYENVLTPGSAGIRNVVYESVIDGDKTVSRREISSEVITPPVDEIIEIGTAAPGQSLGWYAWPVSEPLVTSYFGKRNVPGASANHEGIDLNGALGDPIEAADGGVVVRSGVLEGYGNTIIIEHDNGERTLYAHCSKLIASEGDIVSQGDIIAQIGQSGNAQGVHLHFEIILASGVKTDPLPYMPKN